MSRVLPLLLSVPHGGCDVPGWLADRFLLSPAEVVADGDEGASEIYALGDHVAHHLTTGIARAVVDMNRAPDDFRKDGVVKTHTCWDVPIWRAPLTAADTQRILRQFHQPYHARLSALAGAVRMGVDCHTMATHGPPIGPDPGVERPLVCLGDGHGACPRAWVEALAAGFTRRLAGRVTINEPFAGGYVTRAHGREMPWVQIEWSRCAVPTRSEKRAVVLTVLTEFCADHFADATP